MSLYQLLLLLTTLFFFTTQYASCDQLYDERDEVCCDGTVHVKPSNDTDDYRCCGNQLLFQNNGVCCDNFAYDYKPAKPWRDNVTEGYYDLRCCESDDQVSLYNIRTQRCCEGNVIDVGENSQLVCCGNTTVNVQKYNKGKCCDNVVHDIDTSLYDIRCCGDQPINMDTHLCCSELIQDENMDTIYKRKFQYKQHPYPDYVGSRSQHFCCGLEIFHTESEKCCDGIIHKVSANSSIGCCGTKLYDDVRNKICCPDGKVRPIEQTCCGEGLITWDSDRFCCEDQMLTHSANVSCCWGAYMGHKIYNPTTHECCDDAVVPRPIDSEGRFIKKECCSKFVPTGY